MPIGYKCEFKLEFDVGLTGLYSVMSEQESSFDYWAVRRGKAEINFTLSSTKVYIV